MLNYSPTVMFRGTPCIYSLYVYFTAFYIVLKVGPVLEINRSDMI